MVKHNYSRGFGTNIIKLDRMISHKRLTNENFFKNLSKGDLLLCEWINPISDNNELTRTSMHNVVSVDRKLKEIVLRVKGKISFNYEAYFNNTSNLKDILLIERK